MSASTPLRPAPRSTAATTVATVPTLGAGWAFPIRFDEIVDGSGAFAWATDETSVLHSMQIILSTAKGERAMRPDFGSNLRSLLFAPNTGATRAAAQFEVREALQKWEPRIEVLDVTARVGETAAELLIAIDYRVRSTDTRFNLVYPFYLDRTIA